ncbi:hypothetical protein B0H13DRAFT_2315312 [Mycena leptocephala]|nr:hypothetical protein B0H13DRAFT_2315312 [Mycena leptocephala]
MKILKALNEKMKARCKTEWCLVWPPQPNTHFLLLATTPDFPWPARLCGRYDLSFDLCARATPLPSVLRSHTIRIRSLHLIRGAAHARTLPGYLRTRGSLPFAIHSFECVFVITLFPALITPSNHSPHTLSVFILSGDADPLSSLQFGATTATSDTINRHGRCVRRQSSAPFTCLWRESCLCADGASGFGYPFGAGADIGEHPSHPFSAPLPGPSSVFIPIPVPTFDS